MAYVESKKVTLGQLKTAAGQIKQAADTTSDNTKIAKVSSATANNLPKLNSDGTLADSGTALSSVITTADIASDAEVQEMLTELLGTTAPSSGTGTGE